MALERSPFEDMIGALIADDPEFEKSLADIVAESETVEPEYESRTYAESGIDIFTTAVRERFDAIYARYPSSELFADHGSLAFEDACLELMIQHGLRKGDTVGTTGESVVLIMDIVEKQTIVYQIENAVVGELQGPIALDMPDDLNLATLGEIGQTPFGTGLLIDRPRIVLPDGGMVEAEEFSLGPAVLMFGAPGVSFVKRYYQD